MSNDVTTTLITVLLGGGLATLLTKGAQGWSSLRTGARSRAREVVSDLSTARDVAEDRQRAEATDRIFWQNMAARYAYQLRVHGFEPDPSDPRPPSAALPTGTPVAPPAGPRASP